MGIFRHGDIFSSKYTTALVSDMSNHLYAIPIKNVLGDFFLAEIEKDQIYCFQIDSSREKTYRNKAAKSCKVLFYDTNHMKPISPENNKELEIFLQENRLPKVNKMMLRALSHLGNKESHHAKDFVPHNLLELFEAVTADDADYGRELKNFNTFFKNLGAEQIVKPTKKISEFLIEDLITTSPQFYGMVLKQYELTDESHKKVTNQPKTSKTNWLLIMVILVAVVALVGMLLYLNSTGAFSHLVPTLPGSLGPTLPGQTGSSKLTMAQIGSEYPTPKSLVDAITAHQVSCAQLPNDAVKMVNDPTGGGAVGTCP